MKPSDNHKGWTAEAIEEAQQRYQAELMLRLQLVDSYTLAQPKTGWQPGFEKVYAQLCELDDPPTYTSIPCIVKH